MQVYAKATGFYNGGRVRAGSTFDLDESTCKLDSDGNPILPSWVCLLDEKPAPAKPSAKPIFSSKSKSKKVSDLSELG